MCAAPTPPGRSDQDTGEVPSESTEPSDLALAADRVGLDARLICDIKRPVSGQRGLLNSKEAQRGRV